MQQIAAEKEAFGGKLYELVDKGLGQQPNLAWILACPG